MYNTTSRYVYIITLYKVETSLAFRMRDYIIDLIFIDKKKIAECIRKQK